jgi:hypothetical protein
MPASLTTSSVRLKVLKMRQPLGRCTEAAIFMMPMHNSCGKPVYPTRLSAADWVRGVRAMLSITSCVREPDLLVKRFLKA